CIATKRSQASDRLAGPPACAGLHSPSPQLIACEPVSLIRRSRLHLPVPAPVQETPAGTRRYGAKRGLRRPTCPAVGSRGPRSHGRGVIASAPRLSRFRCTARGLPAKARLAATNAAAPSHMRPAPLA